MGKYEKNHRMQKTACGKEMYETAYSLKCRLTCGKDIPPLPKK